ncbi:hypothetical protein RZS08_41370, partial [Arthrospira platensis SPKY1]|nr:hypothetical protein [Arthrospira platensis SPKY1]
GHLGGHRHRVAGVGEGGPARAGGVQRLVQMRQPLPQRRGPLADGGDGAGLEQAGLDVGAADVPADQRRASGPGIRGRGCGGRGLAGGGGCGVGGRRLRRVCG